MFGGLLPKELTQHLIHKLKTLLPTFRLPGKAFTPQLLTAQAGKEAAALGAATLPIHEFLSPARNTRLNIPKNKRIHALTYQHDLNPTLTQLTNQTQLFDLQNDPNELTDLSNHPQHQQTKQQLELLLMSELRKAGDPLMNEVTQVPTNP